MTEDGGGSRSGNDMPKTVASFIMHVPPSILRFGVGYLRMKRRVRKSARVMEAALRENGMPEELVHRLSTRYEEDSRFIEMAVKAIMNKDNFKCWRSTDDSETGN